jgi:hypothetical protein
MRVQFFDEKDKKEEKVVKEVLLLFHVTGIRYGVKNYMTEWK